MLIALRVKPKFLCLAFEAFYDMAFVDLTSLSSHYHTTLPTVSHLQVFEHAVSFT